MPVLCLNCPIFTPECVSVSYTEAAELQTGYICQHGLVGEVEAGRQEDPDIKYQRKITPPSTSHIYQSFRRFWLYFKEREVN